MSKKKQIRVALVSLAGKGGMFHYITQLAQSLKNSVDVSVIIPDHLNHEEFSNISVMPVHIGSNFSEVARNSLLHSSYLRVINTIKQIDPDIVHFTSSHPWNWIIARALDVPILYTIHDPKSHSGERLYLKIPEQIMRKHIDGAIVHSELIKKEVPNFLSEKVFVVPHGRYSFLLKQNRDIPTEKNFLFFGRIEKYKGLSILLKAFFDIQKNFPDWSLTIAGEGSLAGYQEDIDVIKNVTVINRFIDDTEIPELFSKTACVILPYLDASQSGIPYIAYEYQKPVIASNVGAIGDIVVHDKTGLLVPSSNSEALAHAMTRVINNPDERIIFGQNGFKLLNEHFGAKVIAEKTVGVYESVLNQN